MGVYQKEPAQVGGLSAAVLPAPDSVPVSDPAGNIDPGWMPEVYALTQRAADQALNQFNLSERLSAAGL